MFATVDAPELHHHESIEKSIEALKKKGERELNLLLVFEACAQNVSNSTPEVSSLHIIALNRHIQTKLCHYVSASDMV